MSVFLGIVSVFAVFLALSLTMLFRIRKNEESLRQLIGEYRTRTDGLKNELAHAQTRIEQSDSTLSYERAYDPLPYPVFVLDAEGRCQFANAHAASFIGKDKRETLLRPISECLTILNAEGTPLAQLIGRQDEIVLSSGSVLINGDSRIRITGMLCLRGTVGRATGSILTFIPDSLQDTEREQMNDSQRKLTERVAWLETVSRVADQVISESGTALIVTDPTLVVRTINHAAERITGLLEKDAKGQDVRRILGLLDENDTPVVLPFERAALGTPVPFPGWSFIRNRNQRYAVTGSIIPIHDSGGAISDLAIRISDATQEYTVQNQERAFFSGAAHDLRSPLTTIRGVIELLLEDDGKMTREQIKELLTGAKDSVIFLVKLVNDLLSVSRLDMGRAKITRETFDIYQSAATAIDISKPLIGEKPLSIEHPFPAMENRSVRADKEKTMEILQNLITNAIKYTSSGVITVTHDLHEGGIRTLITDTGSGIAKEDQPLLFGKFQQVGTARKQGLAKSTGLGLYISKEYTRLMNGTLRLETSEPGKGSVFSLTLPMG